MPTAVAITVGAGAAFAPATPRLARTLRPAVTAWDRSSTDHLVASAQAARRAGHR